MNIASYFCPFSHRHHATADFSRLTVWEKLKTITVAALAAIATLPLIGLGGVAAFRAMVRHYAPINPKTPSNSHHEQVAAKTDDVAQTAIREERKHQMEQQYLGSGAREPDSQTSTVQHPAPAPEPEREKPKRLNAFSAEDVQAYVSLIKEGKSEVMEMAHGCFMEECEEAKAEALRLHETFKEKFETIPMTNELGYTYSTLTQFKVAQKILRKEFPGLSSLAFNKEQKQAVARLMQIIMSGEQALVAPLPYQSSCFILNESMGKSTARIVEEKSDFLADGLEQLIAKREGESYGDHLKRGFLHAVSLFFRDNMGMKNNSFKIFGTETQVHLSKAADDPARVAEIVRDQLMKELTEDPQKVREMVDEAKQNRSFVQWLKHWFPESENLDQLLSESLFTAVLADVQAQYADDEVVRSFLLRLIENCRIDDEAAQRLSIVSGCELSEVKSLARIRFLQMVLLLNPSLHQEGMDALNPHLQSYGDEGGVLHAQTAFSSYSASPGCLFQNLSTTFFNRIYITPSDYEREGVIEHFETERLPLAMLSTSDELTHVNSGKTTREVTGIYSLSVSWQIPESILDHLIGQISPEALSSQPKEKYPQVREELENDQSILETLAKIQPQAPQETRWGWNWFWPGQAPAEFEDVQRISETIGGIQNHVHEFLQVISILDEQNDQDLALLRQTRARLSEVYLAIANMAEHYRDHEGDDQAQALDQVLGVIDAMIGQLPGDEGVETPKTFWERLGGTFSQSSEANDLAWKVRKYETQIRELKALFEKEFAQVLGVGGMEGSWVLVGEEADVVSNLYATLCEFEIDPSDDTRFNQGYLAQVRNIINQRFIPTFRQEFQAHPNNEYLHQIASLLFTDVSLEKQCFETLDTFNKMGAVALGQMADETDETVHGEHPFVKRVMTMYKRLGAVPYSAKAPLLNQWANSARGQWNRDFDPYRQGNPTHHFWSLRVGGKLVKMLGMGTPTNEDSKSVARLNEEFVALMRHYKTTGKKHLFVNNQNLIPKTGWLAYFINGDETARCNLILDKQDDEDVKGAYFAIALSKNSKFYWQKGEWAEAADADTFKGSLFDQVCQGTETRHITGCYIPQTIRDLIPEFDAKAKNVIDQIHEKVFAGSETLTVEQRRWFIELFYDNLVKMIIVEGDMDSVNESCKDQIDRGAGSNSQLAANCYLVEQDEGVLTKEQEEHVLMLMMVRALLVRKRPPLPERVERFAEGMDMSFKHVDQLKELHDTLFPETPFVPQRVVFI